MDITFVKASDIKKLKADSDYFIIGLHFYDPYIFDKAYLDKYFKLPYKDADLIPVNREDTKAMPSKLAIAEYIKEILATGRINPPCLSDDDIKSYKGVTAFLIYVNIYGFSENKERPYTMATTEISILTNPRIFDPKDESTYRIKSNNKILQRVTKKNNNVEDYGEE